jgi:hypothetical protein
MAAGCFGGPLCFWEHAMRNNPIAISSGHGKHIRGASGYLDEVDEARRVVARVAEVLTERGVTVCGPFNDDTSTTQDQNLNRIVDWHNSQERVLDVSVHFNANETTSSPMGTEVLYVTQQMLAAEVSTAIADAGDFKDRGAKKRTDLFVLNNTDMPAILLEVCFVDSSADAELYEDNFEAICEAIAQSICDVTGEDVGPQPPDRPDRPELPIERPELSKGDQGPWVESVQRTLGLPLDGDFGNTTQAGVQGYQRAVGLSADGKVDEITWKYLDELDRRMANGDAGLSDELAASIDELVADSGIEDYSWPDRGQVPIGYYNGVAKTYALAIKRYANGDGAIAIMAQAETGSMSHDALTWYHDEFDARGMRNDANGVDTLRHLFVMLTGLGVRESSGNHWTGRDMSADNVESDTCEAGAWQSSWNLSNCSSEIGKLFDEFKIDPNAFRPSYSEGVSPYPDDLDNYGGGDGATYQFLAKYSPAFAALMTGVGMRLLGGEDGHWGPIRRREVTIEPRIDELLTEVELLVENEGIAPPGPRPDPRPPQPEPGAAYVAVNVSALGRVIVKIEESTNEPSDEVPEVTISVRSRGSVAVSVNHGTPGEIADALRVGKVRHA